MDDERTQEHNTATKAVGSSRDVTNLLQSQ
jgi:hypothetical protein